MQQIIEANCTNLKQRQSKNVILSVVVPVFNEEEILEFFFRHFQKILVGANARQ